VGTHRASVLLELRGDQLVQFLFGRLGRGYRVFRELATIGRETVAFFSATVTIVVLAAAAGLAVCFDGIEALLHNH
jgi:hypothetical protein